MEEVEEGLQHGQGVGHQLLVEDHETVRRAERMEPVEVHTGPLFALRIDEILPIFPAIPLVPKVTRNNIWVLLLRLVEEQVDYYLNVLLLFG